MKSLSDAELIVASQSDPARFRAVYDRWAEPILAYFFRRTRDGEASADLMAETFAIAYQKRGSFKDTGTPGGAWLYGIARNELSHYCRRQEVERRGLEKLKLEVPTFDQESADALQRLVEQEDYFVQLELTLAQMSPAERKTVELRVLEELDYTEIATTLGITEGNARTRVNRGLTKLRKSREVNR